MIECAASLDVDVAILENGNIGGAAAKTRREEVTQAIQTLEAVSARLLGTVLNGTPAAKTHTSAGYGDNAGGSDGVIAAAVRTAKAAPAAVDLRTDPALQPFPYGSNRKPNSRH